MMTHLQSIVAMLAEMPVPERVEALNAIRKELHAVSPFAGEPVDCVLWVKQTSVTANDYNPNSVAPPEMELLKTSILEDGYTQPIVGWPVPKGIEVVDGFHRNRVGRECAEVAERVHGFLPVAVINEERRDRSDRIAATIRHNRARGKHKVEAMSDIVIELKRRNWTNEKIASQLGMDQDEVLRLCQITGLAEMFADSDFTESWDLNVEPDFKAISEEGAEGEEPEPTRIYHTWEKWECYPAGFYESTPPRGMTKDDCEAEYARLLRDDAEFRAALQRVLSEWPKSCEQYLSNDRMNRIAWLGQASLCITKGIPANYRNGFNALTLAEQSRANQTALEALNQWLGARGLPAVDMEGAGVSAKADLY